MGEMGFPGSRSSPDLAYFSQILPLFAARQILNCILKNPCTGQSAVGARTLRADRSPRARERAPQNFDDVDAILGGSTPEHCSERYIYTKGSRGGMTAIASRSVRPLVPRVPRRPPPEGDLVSLGGGSTAMPFVVVGTAHSGRAVEGDGPLSLGGGTPMQPLIEPAGLSPPGRLQLSPGSPANGRTAAGRRPDSSPLAGSPARSPTRKSAGGTPASRRSSAVQTAVDGRHGGQYSPGAVANFTTSLRGERGDKEGHKAAARRVALAGPSRKRWGPFRWRREQHTY